MKINKNKLLVLTSLSLISISSIPAVVISCSNSKKDGDSSNDSNSQPSDNILEQLVKQGKINFKLNDLGVSQSIFNQYRSNLNEMSKLLILVNNSNFENIEWKLNKSPIYNSSNQTMTFDITLVDSQNNSTYSFRKDFSFKFDTEQDYITKANETIATSIYLNEDYQNVKIIEMFRETKSNE